MGEIQDLRKELLEFDVNPYHLCSDLCWMVYGATMDNLRLSKFAKGASGVLDEIEINLQGLHKKSFSQARWKAIKTRDDTDYYAKPAALLSEQRRARMNKEGHSLIDEYRRFFKVFGAYLASFENLKQFTEDPFLRYALACRNAQERLWNVYDQSKNTPRRTDPTKQTVAISGEPDRGLRINHDVRKFERELLDSFSPFGLSAELAAQVKEDIAPYGKGAGIGYIELIDRFYEVWMETMTTCGCCLALLSRRNEETWNRVQRISDERTQGYATGVCAYKLSGDVYRRLARMLRERDYDRLLGPGHTGSLGEDNLGVLHFARNSILCEEDNETSDITPISFRKIGSAYFLFHLLNYLQTLSREKPNLLFAAANSTKDLSVNYFVSCLKDEPKLNTEHLNRIKRFLDVDTDSIIIRRFRDEGVAAQYCQAVLGIDQGTYAISAPIGSEIPYTTRRTSEDYHWSFRLAYRDLLENHPEQLEVVPIHRETKLLKPKHRR